MEEVGDEACEAITKPAMFHITDLGLNNVMITQYFHTKCSRVSHYWKIEKQDICFCDGVHSATGGPSGGLECFSIVQHRTFGDIISTQQHKIHQKNNQF
jgi:hypothetical protein